MTALSPRRTFSGTALKTIACITMLVDHIGASCIEAGILTPGLDAGTLSQATLSAYPLYRLDMVLRFTGRLAFPLFCFLLVEGFVHTHNVKGYLGRLVLFGLLSEIPFDLAFLRTPFYPGAQNVYWTLALGVLAMAGLKRFEKENGLPGWQGLVWAGGCAALALAANTDYSASGVLIICALYLTRADRKRQCLVGAVLFLFELTAPLAFVLVWFYNGQRGACSPLQKRPLLVLPGASGPAGLHHQPAAVTRKRAPAFQKPVPLLLRAKWKKPVISRIIELFLWSRGGFEPSRRCLDDLRLFIAGALLRPLEYYSRAKCVTLIQ